MTIDFGKDKTLIIKGVAIIFMMLLHCYGKEHYLVEVDFSHAPLSHINDVFKICVGIFVFMVGYGYNFSKTKDWRYSLQHIEKLLIPFWIILFIFTIPFCYKEFIASGWITMLYNLVGIDSQFNYYSWFVYFFIYAMIVMPFLARFINRCPLRNLIITVVVAYFLEVAVHAIPGMLENKPLLAIFNCLFHTPGMALGYYFAHKSIYQRIRVPSQLLSLIIGMAMIVLPLIPRHFCTAIYGFQLDFIYAPIVICGILLIFNSCKLKILNNTFIELGKVSVYMWFFHALFFTKAVSWAYQSFITVFKDVNLVIIWAILLTFITSWIINYIIGLFPPLKKWA